MARLRGDGDGRNFMREIERALHRAAVKEVLRIAAQVMGQVRQRVIAGIDCPDDFLERADGVARGIRNFLHLAARRRRQFLLCAGHVAQQ